MNSEKKWKPCRQKPTTSTIEKLMIASTPVIVNWLVTVNGWTPGITPNGIMPIRLANRMKMKIVNTQGRYLRPSGPILVSIIELMKPVTPSTATCQRPGTSSRFMPPSMKTRIEPSTIIIHSAELVKAKGLPAVPRIGSIWNWCIGSMVDDCSAATFCFPQAPVGGCFEIFHTSQIARPNPRNSIATQIPLVCAK